MAPSSYYSSYPMYNREYTSSAPASRSATPKLPPSATKASDAVRRESRPMSRRASAVSHRSRASHATVSDAGGGSRRAKSEVRASKPLTAPSRRLSCGSLAHHQKRAGSGGGGGGGGGSNRGADGSNRGADAHVPYHIPGTEPKAFTGRERCYDQPKRHVRASCHDNFIWDHGKYVRDECGSGIVPKRFNFIPSRKIWCKTPLSMYQATIGELGRQILCREKVVPRDVKPEPPCNIAEYILPPCGGYYRRYDCLRPCEEEYTTIKQGHKTYRDRVARYWEPCLTQDQKNHLDVNTYAGHNVYLGIRMRRKNVDLPCW